MRHTSDEPATPAGDADRRPRPPLLWAAGAAAVLVAVAAGIGIGAIANGGSAAQAFTASEIRGVTIDPGVDDVDLSFGSNDVDVIVHNGFGRDIPGVTMELTIEEPEGDHPKTGVRGGEEFCDDGAGSPGVAKADAIAECERLQKSGAEWCRPKVEFPELGTQHSECHRTLHPGENRYLYDMELSVEDPTKAQLYNYPDLLITVVLTVDGTEIAREETEIPGEATRS